MLLINGITLLILGIVAVPTLFLPEKWTGKISPYRKPIGIIYFFLGILEIIACVANPQWFEFSLFSKIATCICAIDKIMVGFMLGYDIFKKKNNKTSNRNMEFLHFKTTMGIITLGLGFCLIVIYIVMKIS